MPPSAEVTRPKSNRHLTSFLEAARQLNVEPSDCLVIEDSHNGMHAAHAAGMEVLAVPNRLTSILDFSQAAWFAESLSELISSDTAQPGS